MKVHGVALPLEGLRKARSWIQQSSGWGKLAIKRRKARGATIFKEPRPAILGEGYRPEVIRNDSKASVSSRPRWADLLNDSDTEDSSGAR